MGVGQLSYRTNGVSRGTLPTPRAYPTSALGAVEGTLALFQLVSHRLDHPRHWLEKNGGALLSAIEYNHFLRLLHFRLAVVGTLHENPVDRLSCDE